MRAGAGERHSSALPGTVAVGERRQRRVRIVGRCPAAVGAHRGSGSRRHEARTVSARYGHRESQRELEPSAWKGLDPTLTIGPGTRRRRARHGSRLGNRREGGAVTAVHVAKQELRPFFTPKALADYLSISERTVREMLSKERIPSYKVEGQRRIDPVDVEKYLARNRKSAA